MANTDQQVCGNKVASVFESQLLALEDNKDLIYQIRSKLRDMKERISGPQPPDKSSGSIELKVRDGMAILPELQNTTQVQNDLLRELNDLALELREMF